MKRKTKPQGVIAGIGIAVIAMLAIMLAGCNSPTSSSGTDAAAAATLVTEAQTAMQNQDWDTALSDYSQAVQKDPTNKDAQIGYAALSLASISTDSNITSLLSKLGMTGYPTKMNDVFNPDNWLATYEVANPDGTLVYNGSDVATMMLPVISGATDTNDNGVLDAYDELVALLNNAITNGVNVNDIMSALSGALGDKLSVAESAVKTLASDTKFNVTWNMVLSTEPTTTSGTWPMLNGSPGTIVFGKAELQLILAELEVDRAVLEMTCAYELQLNLSALYDTLTTGSSTSAIATLTSLLTPTSDASTHFANAKTAFGDALQEAQDGLTAIASDRAGFFLSTDATYGITAFGLITSSDWTNFTDTVDNTVLPGLTAFQNSLDNSVAVYIPINNYDTTVGPWPTAFTAGDTIEINLGTLFASPLPLLQDSLELAATGNASGETAGDPVYYTWNGSAFAAVTTSDLPSSPYDFSSGGPYGPFWLKIVDITMGGVYPTADLSGVVQTSGTPTGTEPYLVGNSLYVEAIPAELAWNSFTSAGTAGTNSSGTAISSTGSFWIALPQYMN